MARFKEKVQIDAYPVEELGGLLFAYLGPAPAPLVPRWICSSRSMPGMTSASPCCLQLAAMPGEFSRPSAAEWLHGVYGWWLAQQSGEEVPSWRKAMMRPHQRIGFTEFANGVFKRRIVEGTTEDDDIWKIGHPWVFPNILRSTTGTTSTEFQIRVPIDDHNTLHVVYTRYQFPRRSTFRRSRLSPTTKFRSTSTAS